MRVSVGKKATCACACVGIIQLIAGLNTEAAVPRISTYTPKSALVGATVSISGENFSPVPGENIVYFGAVRATVAEASAANLAVKVPAGATFARPSVTVNGLTAFASTPFLPTFDGDSSPVSASTFAASFNLPAGDGPITVVLADIDGDGAPDLVVGNGYGHPIRVFRNIATNGPLSATSFTEPVDFPNPGALSTNPYKLAIADLDGDGKLDLISSGVATNQIALWRNTSQAGSITAESFAPPVFLETGADCRSARAADLDGDGRVDIVSVNYGDSTLSILKNTGTPGTIGPDSFASRVNLATGSGPYDLDIADLDGDGQPDLAVVNMGSSISLFRNVCTNGVLDTNAFTRAELSALKDGDTIAIGDVDGDGKMDLVAGFIHPLKLSVYRGVGSLGTLTAESFAPPVDFSIGNWSHNVALADFNGDARPDLAVDGELPSYISIFGNLSEPGTFTAGSLSARVALPSGWNPWGLAVGDLDADGRPDLVFGNTYDDTVTVYRNISPLEGPPLLIAQPTDQTVSPGENATFSVTAEGSADLAYQWWRGAAPLANATNSALIVVEAQDSDAGEYHVTVTNTFGAVTSSVAVLILTNLAPYIITQPESHTVALHDTTTLSVTARGTRPVSYQWRLNGTELPGATASVLTFTDAQLQDAGTYAVSVSNSLGSILSGEATLTVIIPPTTVFVPNTNTLSVISGWPVAVPVMLVANGNENAVSFSLSFGSQGRGLLLYTGAAPGESTAGASLVLNTNQIASGLLGIAVGMPAGTTFAHGTQELLKVTFNTPVIPKPQGSYQMLGFTDTPLPRQVSGILANPLPGVFNSGMLFLMGTDIEGDTFPRIGGDGSLTLSDWVQVGRFAAGLDIPTPGSEFQRVDCAPRDTRGDGFIKVTDWVQAGRYFGKLDALMAAGGPTSAGSGEGPNPPKPLGPGSRRLQVNEVAGVQGVPVEVPVLLEAEGNENALGFSLWFDPSQLEYRRTSAGGDSAGASLNLNALQPGKLGLTLALSPGAAFPAGLKEVARVTFLPLRTTPGRVAVEFGNAPVLRAVSDAFAYELPLEYIPGAVRVQPPPSLHIAVSGNEVVLAWPYWARDFNLQVTGGPLPGSGAWTNVVASPTTNGSNLTVTVPVGSEAQFFQLLYP